jgi:large subunit ribosomal protein L28
MPRVCHFTGKSTRSGNSYRLRGRKKYLGGVGTKITSITKRKFKPNIQNVNAVVDGVPKRIKVSTKAIKMGLVEKPQKRKYNWTRKQKAAAAEG